MKINDKQCLYPFREYIYFDREFATPAAAGELALYVSPCFHLLQRKLVSVFEVSCHKNYRPIFVICQDIDRTYSMHIISIKIRPLY